MRPSSPDPLPTQTSSSVLGSRPEAGRRGCRHEVNPFRRSARSTGMNASQHLQSSSWAAVTPRRWWLIARGLGGLATLAAGAVPLQQFFKLYSDVPTIGTLFVLNFAGATVIGLALLAPLERVAGRLGEAAVAALALGPIGLAATAFVFLFVAERTPLFGFMEPGYDPAAITASRVAEVATVVLLGVFLAARFVARIPMPRW